MQGHQYNTFNPIQAICSPGTHPAAAGEGDRWRGGGGGDSGTGDGEEAADAEDEGAGGGEELLEVLLQEAVLVVLLGGTAGWRGAGGTMHSGVP